MEFVPRLSDSLTVGVQQLQQLCSLRSRVPGVRLRIGSISNPSPGRRCSPGPPCKLAGPARCPRSAKPTVAYSPQAERATGVLLPYFRKLRDLRRKPLGPFCPSLRTLRSPSYGAGIGPLAPCQTPGPLTLAGSCADTPTGTIDKVGPNTKRWLSSNA